MKAQRSFGRPANDSKTRIPPPSPPKKGPVPLSHPHKQFNTHRVLVLVRADLLHTGLLFPCLASLDEEVEQQRLAHLQTSTQSSLVELPLPFFSPFGLRCALCPFTTLSLIFRALRHANSPLWARELSKSCREKPEPSGLVPLRVRSESFCRRSSSLSLYSDPAPHSPCSISKARAVFYKAIADITRQNVSSAHEIPGALRWGARGTRSANYRSAFPRLPFHAYAQVAAQAHEKSTSSTVKTTVTV